MDRQHHHCGIGDSKIDGIRKSCQHRSPRFVVNARKSKRTDCNAFDERIEFLPELLSKASAPRFVPVVNFKHFVFGLWPENNFECHVQPCSFARTSAQGIAEFGFLRCSAHRRSSSARSSSDSWSSPSRSASLRLPHRAIASSARSLAGSLRSSARGLEGITSSSHGPGRRCNSADARNGLPASCFVIRHKRRSAV